MGESLRVVPKLEITGLTWRLDLRLAEDSLIYPLSLVGADNLLVKSVDEVHAAALRVHSSRSTSLRA